MQPLEFILYLYVFDTGGVDAEGVIRTGFGLSQGALQAPDSVQAGWNEFEDQVVGFIQASANPRIYNHKHSEAYRYLSD